MENSRDDVLGRLAVAVLEMDQARAASCAREALLEGIEAYAAVESGLARGMELVNERFVRHEYFIPELLLCSDAMYAGLDVLRPHLRAEGRAGVGTVVLGVVEGDTHDIGKNLVRAMVESSGARVIDLGRNVPLSEFVDVAEREHADVVAMSTLMTSTMRGMERVVSMIADRGLGDRVRTIIGGAPVSAGFASEIGADAYAPNAAAAVAVVQNMVRACG